MKKCPDCGMVIANQAIRCPKCKYTFTEAENAGRVPLSCVSSLSPTLTLVVLLSQPTVNGFSIKQTRGVYLKSGRD